MLIQPITFTDFNGTKRTEELFFNLNEAEVIALQIENPKGLEKTLQDIADSGSQKQMLDFIKSLIGRAYGVQSDDGLYFRKTPEILADFESSAMYSDFLLSLFQDGGQPGFNFIKGVLPPSLVKQAMAKMEGQKVELSAREQFEARNNKRNAQTARVVDFTEREEAPVEENTQKSSADYVVEEPTVARVGTERQEPIFGGTPSEPVTEQQVAQNEAFDPDSYQQFLAWQKEQKLNSAAQEAHDEEDGIRFSQPIHQQNVQPAPEEAPLRRRAIQDNPQA